LKCHVISCKNRKNWSLNQAKNKLSLWREKTTQEMSYIACLVFSLPCFLTQHWGAFVQTYLQLNSNNYYIIWVCVCSLKYPARHKRGPYWICYPLWAEGLYNIFSTLSHKRHNNRKKVIGQKTCILIFSTTFVWNISHYKESWARYDQKCILVFV